MKKLFTIISLALITLGARADYLGWVNLTTGSLGNQGPVTSYPKLYLLGIWAHPDDECAWSGGIMPYAAFVLGQPVADMSVVGTAAASPGPWTWAQTGVTKPDYYEEFSNAMAVCGAYCPGGYPYPTTAAVPPITPNGMDLLATTNDVGLLWGTDTSIDKPPQSDTAWQSHPGWDIISENWDWWYDGKLDWDTNQIEGGYLKTSMHIAQALRNYRPNIIVYHAWNGEYGNPNHICVNLAVRRAVTLAADPSTPGLTGTPWHPEKVYEHLYGWTNYTAATNPGANNQTPVGSTCIFWPDQQKARPELGWLTPMEVGQLAEYYLPFGSTGHAVSSYFLAGGDLWGWPCEEWGLVSSTVGPDVTGPDGMTGWTPGWDGRTNGAPSVWPCGDIFQHATLLTPNRPLSTIHYGDMVGSWTGTNVVPNSGAYNTESFTVAAWVQSYATTSLIIAQSHQAGIGGGYTVGTSSSGKVAFWTQTGYVGTGGYIGAAIAGPTLTTNLHQIVATYDWGSREKTLYVDGTKVAGETNLVSWPTYGRMNWNAWQTNTFLLQSPGTVRIYWGAKDAAWVSNDFTAGP